MRWRFWRRELEPETFMGFDLKELRAGLEAKYGEPFPHWDIIGGRDNLPRWLRPP